MISTLGIDTFFRGGGNVRMSRSLPRSSSGKLRLGVLIFGVIVIGGLASAARAQPLQTAFVPAGPLSSEVARIERAGATAVRINVRWSAIAPASPTGSFDARDPADEGYEWTALDAEVNDAVAAGLEPLLDIVGTPEWAAKPGHGAGLPATPEAAALGQFAAAAAARYSGSFQGLPRVRYWEVWNEPNLSAIGMSPQLVNGIPVAPKAYRSMVNAVAAAVKRVHRDNLVVAGELAPFRDITPETFAQDKDWGPLSFMRSLFCLSKTLRPTCSAKLRFDVWSLHPYTSGDARHHAVLPDDVSLGDLPKVRSLLAAAARAGHIQSPRPVKLWVTEFSWDSSPPDPRGVPTTLLRRWVPEALYQMWRNGVSLVTWFLVRDEPLAKSPYQSGLYYAGGRPKPYMKGFRFPLVAYPRKQGFYVWGRLPFGRPGTVRLQQRTSGNGWRTVGRVRSDRFGIFHSTVRAAQAGWVRGLARGESTLPFSLASVPDRFFNPFGNIGSLEPRR